MYRSKGIQYLVFLDCTTGSYIIKHSELSLDNGANDYLSLLTLLQGIALKFFQFFAEIKAEPCKRLIKPKFEIHFSFQ